MMGYVGSRANIQRGFEGAVFVVSLTMKLQKVESSFSTKEQNGTGHIVGPQVSAEKAYGLRPLKVRDVKHNRGFPELVKNEFVHH